MMTCKPNAITKIYRSRNTADCRSDTIFGVSVYYILCTIRHVEFNSRVFPLLTLFVIVFIIILVK